ncbi:hypothetical protein [Nostoc punctiforme]|uniref:Uncharacterized protein n=2 Tax=Nostoc punctiforme TaxID=272131 RepID=B2ITC9_NOSP7|nr:hypothetical protein [Nostoc punctiforme]ACC81160.1 hypothetical protein Npun_R2606 [Nostoc punctiforme PCC 73102]RCJ42090.1 hypothetical protein A6769_38150 [Nostoc punctiforme NIES-2108]
MLTRYSYRIERPVLYNNVNTERLYGRYITPTDIAKIGGHRRILPGSILTTANRILPRAKIISPYASDATTVIVNNPWAFKPGDVLKVIGTPSSTPTAENAAVVNASAAAFGTVTAVSATDGPQTTTVTIASPAVGNIFTLTADGISFGFTATTTVPSDVATGLKTAFDAQKSQTSSWADIDATVAGAVITFTHRQNRAVFTVTSSVAQGTGGSTGTAVVAVTTPVGALTITASSSNGNQVIGTKIGTITDTPLCILTHEYYLTDDEGQDRGDAIAGYNMAAINTLALPYIDGHIVASMPRLSFIPIYTGG